jgi:dTMP kinase
MKPGILITLEGNEGCGKSTQIKLLYHYLKKKGKSVFLTREPGGTKIGDGIRQVLLDTKNSGMSPITETLLYMASRAQIIQEVIAPRLKKGQIVLCDRWMDATVAYQGFGGGVDVEWIHRLGKEITQGVTPALSIYLDLPVKIGLKRATSHKAADRMEKKNIQFHEKVRNGFLWISKKDPKRFKRISLHAEDSKEIVFEKILKELHRVGL